jgi:dihydrodipicolinate synthase/N-acetylneuraminate lyase
MLSDEERAEVLKTARESCNPGKVLIAGTGAESALETLRMTEYAAALGYDLALVRTPFFFRKQMQPANMLAFYRTVADRSPIPVLIYSVPPFTQYDIPTELVAELAEHPNIIGIKESSGDVEKVRRMVESTHHIKRTATVTTTFAAVTPRMLKSDSQSANGNGNDNGGLVSVTALAGESLPGESKSEKDLERRASRPSSSSGADVPSGVKTRQKEVGFQVLVGAAQKLHPSLEAGAVGGILAFACPAPTACYEIYAAWKEGDNSLAGTKQERISIAAARVVAELGISATKYAMDLNGYYGGPSRLPLLPLTADGKTEVEQLMADIRN